MRGCFYGILYLLEDRGLIAVILGEKLKEDGLLYSGAFPAHQFGIKILRGGFVAFRPGLGQLRVNGVIILFLESGYFFSALGYQAHSYRLDAAGGKAALYLAPEQRGKLIAHDAVYDAA